MTESKCPGCGAPKGEPHARRDCHYIGWAPPIVQYPEKPHICTSPHCDVCNAPEVTE